MDNLLNINLKDFIKKNNTKIDLYFKNIKNNENIKIESINSNINIYNLKNYLRQSLNEINNIKLFHKGILLDDKLNLNDYNIKSLMMINYEIINELKNESDNLRVLKKILNKFNNDQSIDAIKDISQYMIINNSKNKLLNKEFTDISMQIKIEKINREKKIINIILCDEFFFKEENVNQNYIEDTNNDEIYNNEDKEFENAQIYGLAKLIKLTPDIPDYNPNIDDKILKLYVKLEEDELKFKSRYKEYYNKHLPMLNMINEILKDKLIKFYVIQNKITNSEISKLIYENNQKLSNNIFIY